jgi:hypothetical protein
VEGLKPKCVGDGGVRWQCCMKTFLSNKFSYHTTHSPPPPTSPSHLGLSPCTPPPLILPLQLGPFSYPPPTTQLPLPPIWAPQSNFLEDCVHKTTYAPMIYTAPHVRFLMRAEVGKWGKWVGAGNLEFFGPQLALAYRLVHVHSGHKTRDIRPIFCIM